MTRTKTERIDALLADNAKVQAQLGADSTPEEKREAKEYWMMCLGEIAMIDKAKAVSLAGNDDFSLEAYIKNLLSWRTRHLKQNATDKANASESRIIEIFKQSSANFSLEFVLETLDTLGLDASILPDGIGNWAMPNSRRSQVCTEPSDLHMNFFVMEHQWCKTVREALTQYLEAL